MDKEIYVLDACSLIAFFNDEPGAEKVQELFQKAVNEEAEIFLHAINFYEIYYDCLRAKGTVEANELFSEIDNLPITLEREISDRLITEASYFKVNEKVSLADSIMLGLAKIKDAAAVSSDHHEFDPIAIKKLVNFFWIR